jgi:seryl-tRNA synthetase
MLDIKLIRTSPELVRANLERREDPGKLELLDELVSVDASWRNIRTQLTELQHKRNETAARVAELKKRREPADALIAEVKGIGETIRELEQASDQAQERSRFLLMSLPNLMHESVPAGRDERDNVPVREWGARRELGFQPRSHVDVLEALDVADMERAARIAGARFYYLKRELVLMDLALQRLALELLASRGFILVEPPYMISRKAMEGAVNLGDFEDVIYKLEGEDLYLIATSEHSLAGLHMGEVLDRKDLPLRYAGVSACFRKEAGAHGKDMKGIFRVHQFNKVEQFVFARPEDSWEEHERLIANAEDIFKALELPHRVVSICTGDLGGTAAKKYDLEAWMPAQGAYREMVSCSNCTDYQARKLGIRYRERPDLETQHVHTLNSTAIATGRAMVAIIENYQQADGSVKVPDALVPLMGGVRAIGKR